MAVNQGRASIEHEAHDDPDRIEFAPPLEASIEAKLAEPKATTATPKGSKPDYSAELTATPLTAAVPDSKLKARARVTAEPKRVRILHREYSEKKFYFFLFGCIFFIIAVVLLTSLPILFLNKSSSGNGSATGSGSNQPERLGPYLYNGCWMLDPDASTYRDMFNHADGSTLADKNGTDFHLTNMLCADECYNGTGSAAIGHEDQYPYNMFGTFVGYQCVCANALGFQTQQVLDSDCDQICDGGTDMCGAQDWYHATIYSMDVNVT